MGRYTMFYHISKQNVWELKSRNNSGVQPPPIEFVKTTKTSFGIDRFLYFVPLCFCGMDLQTWVSGIDPNSFFGMCRSKGKRDALPSLRETFSATWAVDDAPACWKRSCNWECKLCLAAYPFYTLGPLLYSTLGPNREHPRWIQNCCFQCWPFWIKCLRHVNMMH